MIDPSKIDIGITPLALLGIVVTLLAAGAVMGAGVTALVLGPP